LIVVDGECLAEGADRVGSLEYELERLVMTCTPWKESTKVLFSLCPTALRSAPQIKERWTNAYGWHFIEPYSGESGSDKALAAEMLTCSELGYVKSIVVLGGDHELVEPAARAISLGIDVTVVGLVGATSRQFARNSVNVLTIPSLTYAGF
jgi:hypothetical protein